MIDLFDRELVESQEEVGARVVAQFRDESDPDRFVWIRAFPDMRARGESLRAFYVDGAVWREHAPAARATMVDTTNALLLRPAGAGFVLPAERPAVGATELPESRALATIYSLSGDPDEFAAFFAERIRPALGVAPIGCYVTDPTPNDFPVLPVRTDTVFVWFALFPNIAARTAYLEGPAEEALPGLVDRLAAPVQRLRLAPTARSLLR